jgi:3-hydroxyisobutyrate dehydrogenase
MPAMMRVGWIGPGGMGTQMIRRVLTAGFPLIAHVRTLEGRQALTQVGARLTMSLREAVEAADLVCVCLYDDAQVRDAILSPDGALAAMRPGSVLVSHVTGSPALAAEIARRAPPGVRTIDAAFSGSREDAANGRITILAGGEAMDIDQARPVLSTYADSILHVGPAGAGQRAKLINNLLFSAQLSLVAEAVRAIDALGMDRRAVIQALQRCSGASYGLRYFDGSQSVEALIAQKRHYLDKDTDTARALASEEALDLALLLRTTTFGGVEQESPGPR